MSCSCDDEDNVGDNFVWEGNVVEGDVENAVKAVVDVEDKGNAVDDDNICCGYVNELVLIEVTNV